MDQGAPSNPVPSAHRLVHIFTVATSLDFVRGQARYVADHGFDVHLVASPDGDLMARFAESEGVSAHEVPMTRAMTPFKDLRSLYRLWRLLGHLRPDFVQAGTPKGGFLGILAATMRHIPIRIYHMHGIRSMTARGWRRAILMLTEWLACRLSTRVLCVSQSARASAIAAELCPPDKIIVLGSGSCNGVDARGRFDPDGVSLQQRGEVRTQLNIPLDCEIVGFVGRVVREKGITELAAAWERLATEFPRLHLLIVGPVEVGDAVPAQILGSLRSHARVRFVSSVTNPAIHYAIMDVVVLPTYREGLPNVPLEGSAMRLPVVATRVPGCVDAIVDGVTGTLVPPYSPEALAQAISAYLHSPDLRRDHGKNGRDRVLRDFVPEVVWQQVVALYASELDSRARR